MSILKKIAYFQNRRDEKLNQKLAKELAEMKDNKGIQEIAENLWNENKNIQSDCLKVLYEIGYISPELIVDYVNDFLKLLKSKNNRTVWGALIALATLADKKSEAVWKNIDDVIDVRDHGSHITVVWGLKTLAIVLSKNKKYHNKIFPILLKHLKECIPRDVPKYTENIIFAIDEKDKNDLLSIITQRKHELKPSQLTKIRRTLKKYDMNLE